MNSDFKNKYGEWAIVTGGTSGIGAALADQIAAKGVNIILVARRENLLKSKSAEISNKHGVAIKTIQADLSTDQGIEKVIEGTMGLEIGLLIPAAAIENHGITTNIDLKKELALIQLNVASVFALTHHFAQQMVKRGKGGILLIASMIGHMPNPYMSNYAGSKAYIINFGTSLHWEMKKKGVHVTVLSPGVTDTPMMKNTDVDITKTPMSTLPPGEVARVGLKALGNKALVIPGAKNNFMVFMATRLVSTKAAISMGGKMMEKAMDSKYL